MNTTNNSISTAKLSVGFWREFYTIFIFYLRIFLLALLFGSIFFFLYAGIKTNRIPLDIIAITFASISTLLAFVTSALLYIQTNAIKGMETLAKLEKEKLELERLSSEIQSLDLQLNQAMLKLEQDPSHQIEVVADYERRKTAVLTIALEPIEFTKLIFRFLLLPRIISSVITLVSKER